MSYFSQYEQHPGEEGWYVYFKPENPRLRSIREQGPLKKYQADDMVRQLNKKGGFKERWSEEEEAG